MASDRPEKLRTIAVEEHTWTAGIRDALTSHGGDATVTLMRSFPGVDERLRDLDELRLARMDGAGVDMQVLSITNPGTQPLHAAEAVPLAQEANDILADAVARRPDRLQALATLPTPDPEAAAEELARAVTELGMVGAMVFPRTGERYLDHDMFRPIFAAAASLGVPIYLHPQLPPPAVRDACFSGFDDELNLLLASGGWGWHSDAGLAALRLILAGTFDRHPEQQLILGHWGEMLVGFTDRANVLSGRGSVGLERSIAEYITGNVIVTAGGVFSHRMMENALSTVGADRVLLALDDPFHPVTDGGARSFLETAPISPDDKAKIAYKNATRLGLAGRGGDGRLLAGGVHGAADR